MGGLRGNTEETSDSVSRAGMRNSMRMAMMKIVATATSTRLCVADRDTVEDRFTMKWRDI